MGYRAKHRRKSKWRHLPYIVVGALLTTGVASHLGGQVSAEKASVTTTTTESSYGPIVSNGEGSNPLAVADGKPLFPMSVSGVLYYQDGDPVEMYEVTVLRIDGQGFWAGVDANDEVFVTPSQDAPSLEVGEKVIISGRMKNLPVATWLVPPSEDDSATLYGESMFVASDHVARD